MFVNVFSLFRYKLRLEKGVDLYLNKPKSLYPRKPCAKFGLNCSSGTERSEECTERRRDRRTNGETDRRKEGRTNRQTGRDRRSEKKNLHEVLAQVSQQKPCKTPSC